MYEMINDEPSRLYNLEIEQKVLGSLVIFSDELAEYIPQIFPDDFFDRNLEEAFRYIQDKHDNGSAINLSVMLSEIGELAKPVRAACEVVISINEFRMIFDRFKELANNRRLSSKVFELMSTGNITVENLRDIVDKEQELSFLGTVKDKAIDNLDEFIKNVGTKTEKVLTGFKSVDKVTGGLRYATVCHIGARPSTGKTAFSLNIANNNLDKRVLFFSLEMSAGMIFERIASQRKSIDYQRFSEENLKSEDIATVKSDMYQIKQDGNLLVLDDVYSIEGIANAAAQIKPKVLIIDYIQKITVSSRKFISMREQIEFVSGELKKIAKFNGCLVIALSQLTRAGKEAPTMSDLKESGALEADGDYIMLIHRPYVLDKKNPALRPETTELIIDKNKFGDTGKIDLCFDGKYQRFTEENLIEKNEEESEIDNVFEDVPF